ncbi:hypothetical protein EU805_10200 [Salipiger sp. IMCC34102]|uniref:hypothetical protein n=1 Tax=Salipiger sp. IMCC34102 TaxID=2510647 RepID=UPI00101D792B|nr:hypothetical protein [Salipiger sp. IMCC34102]RYH02217.1 hypothetical protein EU805_10200 [Salipiger sp. IMCC34102]
MRTAILALALLATPAFADSTSGTVLAFDRVDMILVMKDRTVWELPSDLELPEDLKANDRIVIDWDTNGDNGVGTFNSITRVEE